MFATAALVDMKFKDDRRKQWDTAIAEAKSTRNVIQATGSSPANEVVADIVESRRSGPQDLVQYMSLPNLGAHDRNSINKPTMSKWNEQELTSFSKRQNTTLEAQLKTLSSDIRGASTDEDSEAIEEENSLIEIKVGHLDRAPRHYTKLRDREPKCVIHRRQMERMVLKLITRFLISQESPSTASVTAPQPRDDIELEAKIMARRVALLEAGTIWYPRYSTLNTSRSIGMTEECRSLNKSIAAVLAKETPVRANIDSAVASICYNLLISSEPPSIETYNIMLVHFTRLQQHHLSQAVVDSFFQDSRFRPTSRTIAAFLDHYAAKEDRAGFQSIVQRMRGTSGNMRVRTRRLSALDDPIVQSWMQEVKVIHRNGVLIAKVQRDMKIFNSLILGSLRLVGGRRAAMYVKAALREGCHITSDLFIRVAQVCLSEENKRAAATLLSAIISQWHKCRGAWKLEANQESRGIILQLMDLCGIELSINGSHYLRGDLSKVDFQVFKSWLRLVNLEELQECISRSAKSILGLEILFATSSSRAFTTEQAILWMNELVDRHPITELRRGLEGLLTAIQLIIDGFSNSCKELEAQLFDTVHAGLPAGSREKYDAICKRSPPLDMASKLAFLRDQMRTEAEERNDLIKGCTQEESNTLSLSKTEIREWKWQPSVALV